MASPFGPGERERQSRLLKRSFDLVIRALYSLRACLTLWLAGEGFCGHEVIPLASSVNEVGKRGGCNAENRLSPPGREDVLVRNVAF